MKVTFKLTAAQLVIAKEIVAEFEADWASFDAAEASAKAAGEAAAAIHWRSPERAIAVKAHKDLKEVFKDHYMARFSREGGNLNPIYEPQRRNTNQFLELVGEMVTYEGERYPLVEDGALAVLLKIAGYAKNEEAAVDALARLRVVNYKTSDRRLRWFETLDQYITRAGTLEEIVAYLEKHPSGNEHTAAWAIRARFPEMVRVINGLIAKDRRVHAEFSLAEIRPGRKFAKYDHLVYCMNHN